MSLFEKLFVLVFFVSALTVLGVGLYLFVSSDIRAAALFGLACMLCSSFTLGAMGHLVFGKLPLN